MKWNSWVDWEDAAEHGAINNKRSPCHTGPVEVIENLFCGSADEALSMIVPPYNVDTLVPLHSLDAGIWNSGFRGEILYYPIKDFGTLPDDVLTEVVTKILDRLCANKKVGLFCVGGHGRTGYVAAAVLGTLGYEDPIQFLRTKYCNEAVESCEQLEHIAAFLGKPELVKKYATQHLTLLIEDFAGLDYLNLGLLEELAESEMEDFCGDCGFFKDRKCLINKGILVNERDLACYDFIERM